ncbi:MAG: twin-arginine translocase subunit TatC, partial [Planctomycetota bacterium]|nr:twin-arginine translocase subunit TatC [Planctomycetota bacterium]
RLPLSYAAQSLGRAPEDLVPFQWLAPLDGICALARVDLILAGLITLPLFLYEAWCFLAPGLTPRERFVARAAFTAGAGLFVLGAAAAFFWGAPLALRWLLDFNRSLAGSVNHWTLDGYLAFLGLLMVGFGLAFEMPLLMYILGRLGLLDALRLQRYWRQAALALLVIAAVFTPPEPVGMLILAALLLGLYGLGYLLVWWTQRRR